VVGGVIGLNDSKAACQVGRSAPRDRALVHVQRGGEALTVSGLPASGRVIPNVDVVHRSASLTTFATPSQGEKKFEANRFEGDLNT
jgi:hypothetical protein